MNNINVEALFKGFFFIMFAFAIISFPIMCIFAYLRTNPHHRHYVPPEKRVWRVLTRGDFAMWIYFSLYIPISLTVLALLAAFDVIILEDGKTSNTVAAILFFSGVFVGYYISNRIDKKY